MGSTGSGSFGNYHIASHNVTEGLGAGASGEIQPPIVLEHIPLEDVAISQFYASHQKLPVVGTKVKLRNKVHQGRLAVETINTNEIVGNLPTQYNYILNYLNAGKQYKGTVESSGISPIPYVVVTLRV